MSEIEKTANADADRKRAAPVAYLVAGLLAGPGGRGALLDAAADPAAAAGDWRVFAVRFASESPYFTLLAPLAAGLYVAAAVRLLFF